MATESPSKASTLNPEAPLFVPSPSNAMPSNAMPSASNAVPDDLSEWEIDDFFLVPSSLNATPEDPSNDPSNANAEDFEFVPSSLKDVQKDLPLEWNVEDFSPEWWNLVHTSPAFREYWLQEYETEAEDVYSEMQFEEMNDVNLEELKAEEEAPSGSTGVDVRALIANLKSVKLNVDKSPPSQSSLAYHDKIPKISPKKVAARRIQQPR